MNISIQTGIYPSKLKCGKIIPIFKNEDETDLNNYRPISLVSKFNRVFEKLMNNRLKSFLEFNNVLYKRQFSFREMHSTHYATLDIVNQIQNNMDKKLFSCGIFIDLKKAFDTVDHTILLNKLQYYGIRGIANDWFRSYVSGRTQTTQIDNKISKKDKISCGVPQGSVLDLLLFLIYIHDIYTSSDKFQLYLFADNANLLYADKKLKSLESVINKELANVCEWFLANKLH